MKIGDAVGLIAVLVWMTVSVGPWWVGAGIFGGVWVLNVLHVIYVSRSVPEPELTRTSSEP